MNLSKKDIRASLLNKRNEYKSRNVADSIIADKLESVCSQYNNIFIYASYGSEVNTISVIEKLLSIHKSVYIPVCDIDKCTMKASQIYSIENLRKNKYGILEPITPTFSDDILDLVIFPGAAFDTNGNRIGYGKGYYDKFVSELRYTTTKIGICYDFQLLNKIPNEAHDVKMDMIITEKRIVSIH